MEALLRPRAKDLGLAAAALALAAAVLALLLLPMPGADAGRAQRIAEKDGGRMERVVAGALERCQRRSERLAADFAAGRLPAAGLEPREAVVVEKDGVVADYVGEVYFFQHVDLPLNGWQLIRRGFDVYFLRRVAPHAFHIRFFMDLRSDAVRRAAAREYPVFELKCASRPLPEAAGEFSHDEARDRFHYTRPFASSQNQLVLSLAFSRASLAAHDLRVRRLLAYALAFLFFLAAYLIPLAPGAAVRRLAAAAGMGVSLWLGMAWLGGRDVFFAGFPAVRSVFQLLSALACLFLAGRVLLGGRRRASGVMAFAAFNLLAFAALVAARRILAGVDFPYGDFTVEPRYLALLALLIGLHAAPLLAAGCFASAEERRRAWPLLLAQAALLVPGARFLAGPPWAFPLLSLAFAAVLLQPGRRWLRRAAILPLLALAVHLGLNHSSLLETRAFVSGNLKPVFASQDDYAKLVAREIVYELNSGNIPFSAFFQPGGPGEEMDDRWRNTLAARESIASGIYVVASGGELLHAFSYQMPYIPLHKEDIFPFWHVENVDAALFGRKVRLAAATINVFQGERYLGYIMVQVLNTADLVLKSQERFSILAADRRLRDVGLNYLLLDGEGRILENPANVNVGDLGTLARAGENWKGLRSMGASYSGYVFPCGEGSAIIFFPRRSFFTRFSTYVQVLGFLLLLAAALDLRRLWEFPWRSLFGSFSIKVFAILLLLSLITGGAISMFTLNFNAASQETRLEQAAFRRGRSALNIIDQLLAGGGEITQEHLFLLAKILENDISVYEDDALLYTSDHRKIVRSELPVYLNSGVRDLLRRDDQRFELRRGGGVLRIFFRTAGGYVFDLEFPAESADRRRAGRSYVDFIVTILFALLVLGLAAAFFFRNRIVAPIHRLNRGMAEVQQGSLRPLADIPAESELRELYQGFNSMLEGIREQQRSASEIARMRTLVQLGRRVAHEVKNPLTPIRLSAEQIQRSLRDGGAGEREVIASAVRYIIEETEHLRRVAFGFLNLSKLDELKAEPFRLDALVEETVASRRPIYPQVRFSVSAAGGGTDVVADRQKIRQAVDNVLNNSLEALAASGGRIDVELGAEEGMAFVRVRDDGPGIAAEELERLAREEFSTKELGTGLGLVIARRFLELHRGGLEIESRPGGGTTVTLRFATHAPAS